MASALQWIPDSLYNSALSVVVTTYSKAKNEIRTFPEKVQFDVYYKLYKQGQLHQLQSELSQLDIFARILKVTDKRILLHHCFQVLMDSGYNLSKLLADAYCKHCGAISSKDQRQMDAAIGLGFLLSGFLDDAGWYPDCEIVILSCMQLCRIRDSEPYWLRALECCTRLLHVRNAYCRYREAEETYTVAQTFIRKLQMLGQTPSLAGLFAEFSALFFVRCHYTKAYKWSVEALKEISPNVPVKVIIDVLRQAAKVCVIKRDFWRANLLLKHSLCLARECFGCKHPKYADVLLDYGFYLLNIDSVAQSVKVYQAALDVRQAVFGGFNLLLAIAHEDLGYALYVREYSSGHFEDARVHAQKSMDIMSKVLPDGHLLLASSKRVKALILEEVAIDHYDKEAGQRMLLEAQDLHLTALSLTRNAFGENNVQTAKHYGNLGRLYQSLHRFKDAEEMHLKAITIKEMLLGPNDYEVALSVGHLASLYNYDMFKYHEGEQLYLRSISIAKKLFGESYSGLEYDYRGLLRVYSILGNNDKATEYTLIMNRWKHLRDTHSRQELQHLTAEGFARDTFTVIDEFLSMSATTHSCSADTACESVELEPVEIEILNHPSRIKRMKI